MKKVIDILITIIFFLCTHNIQAQNENIERILRQIEQYNTDLKAFARLKQAKYYHSMRDRSLTGLHVESNYLFLGKPNYTHTHEIPNNRHNFFNLKIGQEFRLPGYYKTIDGRGQQLRNLLDAQENELRQKILLEAKQHCYRLVYANKKLRMLKIFKVEADKLQQVYDTLFNLGSVSILEQQRAVILSLDFENEINQLEIEKMKIQHDLAILNGNKHIYLDDHIYEPNSFLLSIDYIQKQALDNDVAYLKFKEDTRLSERKLTFTKKQNLPIIDLGYSLQVEDRWGVHGIYAGFNLPLWSNKRNVKADELEIHYKQYLLNNQEQIIKREVLDLYGKLSIIERYLTQYEKSLNKLENYEKTLEIALELGEMTLQTYIQNMLDYKEIHFKYIDMEYEYHQLKNELMRWYL